MLSGGSRAAALGYGLLEQFKQTKIGTNPFKESLLDNIDLVFGVSSGSVLATYFSLEGKDVVPKFEDKFLKTDFQSQLTSEIDQSVNIPKTMDVVNTIVNVPIDRNTQTTLRRFRELTDEWNKTMLKQPADKRVELHFVSIGLKDLPESPLKQEVLNINTSFYLPNKDINKLKQAAQILLQNSKEYQGLLEALR